MTFFKKGKHLIKQRKTKFKNKPRDAIYFPTVLNVVVFFTKKKEKVQNILNVRFSE